MPLSLAPELLLAAERYLVYSLQLDCVAVLQAGPHLTLTLTPNPIPIPSPSPSPSPDPSPSPNPNPNPNPKQVRGWAASLW